MAGLLALVLFVMVVAGAETRRSEIATPRLPRLGTALDVDRSDVADPFILPVRAGSRLLARRSGAAAATASPTRYIRFGTSDRRSHVPTAVSTDLIHWVQTPDALPVLPSWATPSRVTTWAPTVLSTAAGWVLFFTTEDAASGLECIGRATAATPGGPYADRTSGPLVCQQSLGGSIDPSTAHDGHATTYLLWKNDGNSGDLPVSVWQQPLTSDGTHLLGHPRRILTAGQPWQLGIIESPAMLAASQGGWWLFYSGGFWRSGDYATGLAYCPSMTGPCHETSAGPFLSSTPSQLSPGGFDTFAGEGDAMWASFSTFVLVPNPRRPNRFFRSRVLDIAPILSR